MHTHTNIQTHTLIDVSPCVEDYQIIRLIQDEQGHFAANILAVFALTHTIHLLTYNTHTLLCQ